MSEKMYVVDDYKNDKIYASVDIDRLLLEIPSYLLEKAEALLKAVDDSSMISFQDFDAGIYFGIMKMRIEILTDYLVDRDCVNTITGR